MSMNTDEKIFNLTGLRRLLNEIDRANDEEIGDYYLETLSVTHGGPKGGITYFQIIGWDLKDRKRSLELYFQNGELKCNKGFLEYQKKFPKTCKVFKNNCYKILQEIVNQGIEVESINTVLRGDVEFLIMKYSNGDRELRGRYYWSENYEDYLLG